MGIPAWPRPPPATPELSIPVFRASSPTARRFGFEDDPEELDRIKAGCFASAQPTLVLVGLGFPKQEQLIDSLRSEMPQAWFVGVGISLSFLAGEQPRAPAAMQRLGLEWMHRLWHEPRRLFGRYLIQGLPFSLRLFGWALAHRLLGRP